MTRTPPQHDLQMLRTEAWGRVLIWTVIVFMVLQLARVVQLKMSPDPRLSAAVGSPISSRPETARRGDVLDRRGRVVATTTLGYRLFVDPQLVSDLSTIAVDIAQLIGGDPVDIDKLLLARRDSRYVVISHLLEDWQVDAIRQASLRGVGLQPRPVRHYPHGELAAQVIGKVGFEHDGLGGIEHRFNERLEPAQGRLTYLRDARRRALWIDSDGYRPSEPGADVRLSVDLVIQDIAERRLRQAVEEYNAGGGRLIVLDPITGEVLALTDILHSRPGWEEATADPLRVIDPALGRNRCVTDPYEPGSTFKPFIWAVATELGRATPEEILPTPASGVYRTSRGRAIRDAYNIGDATWHTTLIKSLNSGMAHVAERLTEREMWDAVRRFGFGEKTDCGLPGETVGIVTSPKDWNHYTQTSVAMGHEIAVTPVQMVRAFAVFARDGTLPSLRLTVPGEGDHEYHFVHRVLSPELALLVREAMRDVVTDGTGRRAQSQHYQLFAKSGTAQLPRKDGRGYHEDRYVSSFIAGAPFTDPRLVVLCVIDDPDKRKGHYGGAIAGPVVRDVMDEALTYLGVAPDQPQPDDAVVSAR